jgi:hypothetical protein
MMKVSSDFPILLCYPLPGNHLGLITLVSSVLYCIRCHFYSEFSSSSWKHREYPLTCLLPARQFRTPLPLPCLFRPNQELTAIDKRLAERAKTGGGTAVEQVMAINAKNAMLGTLDVLFKSLLTDMYRHTGHVRLARHVTSVVTMEGHGKTVLGATSNVL